MKRDRKTSFILTLILIFMFAVFGGGSALGIIKLPFLPMSEDTTSVVSNTANKNESDSPEINIPTGIQLYDPQVPLSSKIEDMDLESSALEDIEDITNDREHSYVAELAGGTANSSTNTSSSPAPGQDTGNSSSSSTPTPADPGTGSSSNSSSSSSSNGTVIPSTRPKPSEGGGSHSVSVQSVDLDQSNVTINRKNTLQLTASIAPQNATKKSVTWTSSNPDVATVDTTGKVTGIGAGATTITVTVGQKSDTCEVTVVVLMDGIALNYTELAIDKGSTEQLTAKITPEDTTEDKTITWTSSDPEIVSVDSDGKVTAHKTGKVTVKASAVGASASCEVTVLSPMTGIALDKSTLTLNRNTTDKLTVSFLPVDTTSKREITWSSSAPEVADVDKHGNVVAYNIGTTKITARCGEFTADCEVTVNALIDGVYLDQSEMTLDRGTEGQLAASIVPLDTTEDKTVTWFSSDPEVATVDAAGKVTGVKIGATTITAKVGGHTASCTVTVVALIHSITLDKSELTLDRDATGQLAVSYDPPDTTEDKTVTWSSSNPDIATVDETGKVTAVHIGTATITAQVGTHTTTCNITVVALIHNISLDKTEFTLDRNTSDFLTVSYDPPDTTEDKTVTWSSSDPDVAVVDSTGKVTGVKIGSAAITAKVGTHTASCSITVVALIHSITLDKTNLTLDRSTSGMLTTAFDPPDTTEDKTITWTSSNPAIVTVDKTGKVTAVQIGSAIITAKVGTHTASCEVTVVAVIKNIALNKSALTIDRSTSDLLAVSYDPPDTTEDKTVTWSSSDTSIATVDSSGKVTGMKIGTTTITAKVGTHTASCEVNVVVLIKSITLDKSALTLDRGTSGQLAVSINPTDTTEDKTVTWSSSNPAVATIDSSGKVTAVQIGTTTITAKVGTHSASCGLNVIALIKNISLNKAEMNLDKGGSGQLTVVFDPADTTESKTVTWTSSNTAVATVSSTGKVTASTTQVGESNITAKVGTHIANCNITVGVKYTITTVLDQRNLDSLTLTVNNSGSGSLRARQWSGSVEHPFSAQIVVSLSKPVSINTGTGVASIIGTLDKNLLSDGEISVTACASKRVYDGSLLSFTATEQTNKDTIIIEFSGRLRAGSSDGKMYYDWNSGALTLFGQPITGTTGYLDL